MPESYVHACSESNAFLVVLPENVLGGRIGFIERSRWLARGFKMDRTTVGSLLCTSQAYCRELCEKETLDDAEESLRRSRGRVGH